MAALRLVKKRVVTKEEARKFFQFKKRLARKLKPFTHTGLKPGRVKLFYEIVATTAQEAQSGMFKQVGNIFIFSPELAEPFLWQRIRMMHLPENWEVWWNPRYGLRFALTKVGLAWPVPEFIRERGRKAYYNYIPQGLIDLRFRKKIPAVIDPIEKRIVTPEVEYEEATYENFVKDKWLPLFVYGNRHAAEGMFRDTRHAQGVAKIFGITVDPYARSESWFKSAVPEMKEYSRRQSIVSEEAYIALRDAILHAAYTRIREHGDVQLDWDSYEERLKELAGPRATEITKRLKAEVEPEIKKMILEAEGFRQNPPYMYSRRIPWRPVSTRNVLPRPSREPF